MTDEQLFLECKKYGASVLEARRKFAGLLPEVNRRRLYEKKGFESIFVFAAKLAGMSNEQVCLVLNLEKRFEDKPALKEALLSGEMSVNKLARVVSIATPENEEALVEKVKILSTRALEIFVRDEKLDESDDSVQRGLHVQTQMQQSFPDVNLDEDVAKELYELQKKGIDVNELLREFLAKREMELAREKEELSVGTKPTNSRYINVKVRRHLKKEHGNVCSIQTCAKPSAEIHHSQRFALARVHDPKYLAPLCGQHHEIAHLIDLKYQVARRL